MLWPIPWGTKFRFEQFRLNILIVIQSGCIVRRPYLRVVPDLLLRVDRGQRLLVDALFLWRFSRCSACDVVVLSNILSVVHFVVGVRERLCFCVVWQQLVQIFSRLHVNARTGVWADRVEKVRQRLALRLAFRSRKVRHHFDLRCLHYFLVLRRRLDKAGLFVDFGCVFFCVKLSVSSSNKRGYRNLLALLQIVDVARNRLVAEYELAYSVEFFSQSHHFVLHSAFLLKPPRFFVFVRLQCNEQRAVEQRGLAVSIILFSSETANRI